MAVFIGFREILAKNKEARYSGTKIARGGSPKRLASPRSSATKRSGSAAPSLVLYRAEHVLPLSLFSSYSLASSVQPSFERQFGETPRGLSPLSSTDHHGNSRSIDEDLSTLDGPRTVEKLARNGVIVEPSSTWKRKRRNDHGQRHHEEPLLQKSASLCH